MKNNFWNTIKNGCVIFTVITLISYTIGMIISTSDKAFIPSLKSIYVFLIFSILTACANRLLKNTKVNLAARLIVHFLACGLLFFMVAIVGGGFSKSGFATLIILAAFVVLYLIFAIIYAAIYKRKEKKENDQKRYSNVFN